MSANRTTKARKYILGRYANWVVPLNPHDFENNLLAIRLLIQEKQLALAASIDLEEQVRGLEAAVHELKMQNQHLRLELDEATRKSVIVFSLSLMATVLVGIGVNIATTKPENWIGWMLIVTACLIEGLAFFSRHRKVE